MPKVTVYHQSYGCDTGCCGHTVTMGSESHFDFTHPFRTNFRKFAEDMVRNHFGEEHVADLDWENCTISDD